MCWRYVIENGVATIFMFLLFLKKIFYLCIIIIREKDILFYRCKAKFFGEESPGNTERHTA